MKDANGHTTGYAYDNVDRLTRLTTPLGYTTTYVYDAASNQISRTDGNGATTRYAFDLLDRLEATMYPGLPVYPSPQTLTYAYDKDGNLVSATGFGFTETRTYDRSGRLASSALTYPTSPSFTSTLLYTYDADGNLRSTTVKDASSSPTTHFYDAVDRLTGLLDGTYNTTYSYDRDSRQVGTNDPNGFTQTTLYDRAGRILYMYTNKTGGGNLETINYTYDAASFRSYAKDVAGSTTVTTATAYDLQHRLRGSSVQDSVHGSSSTADTYDAVGNLVQEVAFQTQTYRYDADNELYNMTSSSGFWIAYAYDRNGNQIAYQTSAHETGSMAYDYENRLIVDGGCSYTYTPTGERASDSCEAGAPNERYDAASPASASNLVAQYNASGARQARYVSAGVDAPVEMVSGSSPYWYSVDGLGSVNRLTDASGATAETYAYDAWGGTTASGGVANPFQFAARTLDSSGLYDVRARRYDPSSNGAHRFTSPDPLGGGHAYVGDSPANFVDPTGMIRVPPHHAHYPAWASGSTPSACTPSQRFSGSCPSETGASVSAGGEGVNPNMACASLKISIMLGIAAAIISAVVGVPAIGDADVVSLLQGEAGIQVGFQMSALATAIAAGDAGGIAIHIIELTASLGMAYAATVGIWAALGFIGRLAAPWLMLGLILINLAFIIVTFGMFYAQGCSWTGSSD